ncbi:MobV family relaxase, partial [Xylanibacter muris]
MTNQKQVLDVHVSKGITAAQSNEHLRDRSERAEKYAMSKGNYDPTRKHLNFEIAPGGKIRPIDTTRNIPERMADILSRRGIKDPNEGLAEPKFRTVVNIIFGGSRKRMHELAFGTQQVDFEEGADNTRIRREGDIERWAKDVYSFVSGKYGEQNIAAFIVHLDELNPHVHCTLLPIKDGRFAYKEIFAGKDKFEYSARMKQLHTDFFAEVNTKWGMSRGTSISETGARHRTTEEYRRMLS